MSRRQTIPKQAASDVPEGLCQYELMEHLGCNREQMKAWCWHTGYKPIDGRSKHSGRKSTLHSRDDYLAALTAGATTKTLEEVGQQLGITRERVRQLYNKFGISRKKQPHSVITNPEAIARVTEAAKTCGSIYGIANATGYCPRTIELILKNNGVVFKSDIEKRNELEATGHRKCTKCGEVKPLDLFYREPTYRAGRMPKCKQCHNKQQKEWRIRTGRHSNPPYIRPYPPKQRKPYDPVTDIPFPHGYKRCSTCKQVKVLEDFCLHSKAKDGRSHECRACKKEYDKRRVKPKPVVHTPMPRPISSNGPTSAFGLTAEQIRKLKEV